MMTRCALNLYRTLVLLLALGTLCRQGEAQAPATATPSAWEAVDAAVGPDDKPRVLWTHPDGRMRLWTVGTTGQVEAVNEDGPTHGWTCKGVEVGTDNKARLLWTNVDGSLGLHRVRDNGIREELRNYGPFSDGPGLEWRALDFTVATDNRTRVLWGRSDGYTGLWLVNEYMGLVSHVEHGPFSTSRAKFIDIDSQDKVRIVWDQAAGISLWTTTPGMSFESYVHHDSYSDGSSLSWEKLDLAMGPDDKPRMLWRREDGKAALWSATSGGVYEGVVLHGPFTGWKPRALDVDANSLQRVLWSHTSGAARLWTTTATGGYGSAWEANTVPANLMATSEESEVRLTWNASPHAEGYKLYRSEYEEGPYELAAQIIGGATEHSDKRVTLGKTYYYKIAAFTKGVESGLSVPVPGTPLQLPTVSIDDVAVAEAATGTQSATFTVSLSRSVPLTVTLNFITADGTAKSPGDYAATSGQVRFFPGTWTQTVTVPVKADDVHEDEESFSVRLAGATNATLGDSSGTCTVIDSSTEPEISVRDISVTEGDSGTTNAVFVLSLSNPSAQAVAVTATTFGGSAATSLDYSHTEAAVTFPPGSTTQNVSVPVLGDLSREGLETFSLALTGANHASLREDAATATATIIDNETGPANPENPRQQAVFETKALFYPPLLPVAATALTLQRKLTSEPDSAYANSQTGIDGTAPVAAPGLSPQTSYHFRYLAVGSDGSTPGASIEVSTPATGSGSGLTGHYFDNVGFTNFALSRLDPQIDFNWSHGSPAPGMTSEFSVRWTGSMRPAHTGTYTLILETRKSASLWINGQLVLSGRRNDWETPELSGQVEMVQGTLYDIRVEVDASNHSDIKLLWSSPDQPKEVVPQKCLFPAVPQNDGRGLRAFLYHDRELTDLALTRVDPMVNFYWGYGSPQRSIEGSTFSVRWKGQIKPLHSETYTFSTGTDDGVRLRVDGQLLIDDWRSHWGPAGQSATISLVAGQRYDIEMEYFDDAGEASAHLWWESPSQRKEIVAQEHLYPAAVQAVPRGSGTGLRGVYYRKDWLEPFDNEDVVLTRLDPALNFDWSSGSPAAQVPADGFCVRWKGQLQALYSERHILYTESDEGVRVRLNGQLIIDAWQQERTPRLHSASVDLVAGQMYDIEVEYFERTGSASLHLLWSSPSLTKGVIPSTQLYPAAPPAPLGDGKGLRGDYYQNRLTYVVKYGPKLEDRAEYVPGRSIPFAQLRTSRIDPGINFAWGDQPDANVGADDFSIRWRGWIQPLYSETYTFRTSSNDGVRLRINDQLLIEDWRHLGPYFGNPPLSNSASITLEAGRKYDIVVEYFDESWYAEARLFWSSPSQSEEIVPRRQLYPAPDSPAPTGGGSGLRGQYYDAADQSSARLERIDGTVDFDWGAGAPDAQMNPETFAVNWTGTVEPRHSELYTFYVNADEGARLYVNGQLLADGWSSPGEKFGAILLTAGRRYAISLEYFERSGNARAQLLWSSPSQEKEVVPRSQLYPDSEERLAPAIDACHGGPQVCPCPPTPHDANFVSQRIPTTMFAGDTYSVSVTMRNTGSGVWSNFESPYQMGSTSLFIGDADRGWTLDPCDWDPRLFGSDQPYYVFVRPSGPPLPNTCTQNGVLPGSTYTFTFHLKAPTTPGTYLFRSRLAHFGDATPTVKVRVIAPQQAGGVSWEPVAAPQVEEVGAGHIKLKLPPLPLRFDKFRIERAQGPAQPILPPPTQGLRMWLRADSLKKLSDGAPVQRWFDISGREQHAVQADLQLRPRYIKNGVGGRPLIRFASRDRLDRSMDTSLSLAGAQEMTIFAVTKAGHYDGAVRFQQGESISTRYGFPVNGTWRLRLDTETGQNIVQAGLVPNQWNVGSAVWKANATGGLAAYRNGALIEQIDTGTGPLAGGTLRVGAGRPFGGIQDCDIAEVLVYDRALSAMERAAAELYLSRRYNVGSLAGEDPPPFRTPAAWTAIGEAGGGEFFTDSGLAPGTAYWYRCVGTKSPLGTEIEAESPAVLAATISAEEVDPPAAPAAPTFGAKTPTSVVVQAPSLPARTRWLKLQRKLSEDPEGAYADVEDEILGGASVTVARLSAQSTYSFRFVAVGDGGLTPGAAADTSLGAPPPEKPETPEFDQVTQSSLRVLMPPLPPRAETLTLQMKLATELDTAFVDVEEATAVVGSVRVVVADLESNTAYRFRCVANGSGGSTVGDVAGISTGMAPPGAPGQPVFTDVDLNSVVVKAPALPQNAQSLTLQGRMVDSAASMRPFVDITIGIPGGGLWTVNGLSSGASYEFRYVAVGSGGRTPGAAGSVTMPSPVIAWSAGTPISCAGIRWPANGTTIAAGAEGKLSSYLATDLDFRQATIGSNVRTARFTDTCKYLWTASAGQFRDPANPAGTAALGQTVRWIAPQVPGTYTVTLTIDDQSDANRPLNGITGLPEGGSRDDAVRGYNDSAQKYTTTIIVR
jgi:hypothetical protein